MCVLVGKNEIEQASGGSTIVATLPTIAGGILANDVIIVAIQNGTAASDITENTTTEYTEFGAQQTNDTQRVALFRKIASGSDVSRTFNLPASGAGSDSICIVSVFRYVDVTGDPIRAVTRTDYAAGYAWENNSGTVSANDGDLLVFLNVQDGAGRQRYLSDRVMFVARKQTTANNGSMVMGMRQLTATATTTAEKVCCTSTSEGGTGYVFALKNASGGARQPMVEDGSTVLNWFGNFADASTTSQQKWSTAAGNVYALNDIISSGTLAGLSISSTAAAVTVGGGTGIRQSTLGTWNTISPTDNSTGIWGGAVWRLPAAVDATGKLLRLHFNNDYTSRVGSNGLCVVLADGTGKWVAYTLATADALLVQPERTVEIAIGAATLLGSSETPSTFDVTTLSKVGIGEHRQGSSTGANAIFVKDMLLLGTSVVTGGGAAWSGNWTRVAQALTAWDYYKFADLQGGVQAVFKSSVQIGDNSRPTYWDSPGGAFAFPTAYSIATAYSQQEWNVNAGVVGLIPDPSASDTINLASGSAYTETQQALTMTGNAGASTSFAQSFVGFAPTLLSGETYVGATFSGCDTVLATGATLTGCTIKAPNSNVGASDAAVSWTTNSTTQADNTIDITGSAAGYFAAFGASITAIEWNNNTLTGTPASGYKFYSELASGTLTITNDGTGTALADTDVEFIGGSTATAVIAAPELYQEVAITGLAATYRLQIFDIEYVLTVSGITVTPTAGATYTHNGITWTVRSASIVAGSGTVTVYGTGTPAASGTLTKTGGTGDASVAFSAYAVDGTELYIGVPGATSYTWTDSVAAAAPRVIRVRVMEDGPGTSDAIEMIDAIVGMCGITDGTESVGYLVAAVADDVYNDRGVDGSAITGITIDDTTLRLEIASGTITNFNGTDVLVVDGRDLYAYETYWLGTTAGMRDEARFIEAVDDVNFRCSNFKLKGTSGYPIMINNCFIVDAATGIFSSMVDYSGDPISNHPEHMKAIVVTTSDSVVTGTLSEFIAAVPTAATNASATRTELATELTRVTKLAALSGIDATLVVTPTSREAGSVSQVISTVGDTTTVESA